LAPEHKSDQSTEPWSRCEFGKTFFAEGKCQRLGEVQLDGSLLCVPHAKLLRLEARESTLLGTMLEMDKWLDNPNNRADELLWKRVRREQDESVEALRFTHMLIEAHKETDHQ
jgi:hypothetical protein